MMKWVSRRNFLSVTSGSAALGGLSIPWPLLPALRAEEVPLGQSTVRFRPEIEPLVRMLEETPREKIVEKVLATIHNGTSYRELLAALFLAGIRNVQPRPAVGFKFHSVLVVNAAHQATIAAADNFRWLPLLWSIDYFKSAQATDVKEGDWTMAAVNESRLPSPAQALAKFDEAMEVWDIEAADAAAAAASRTNSSGQLLDLLARHSARDFRSIGHKAIYVAGAFRLLEVIGWEHMEPIVRSLAYATLNHSGEENPSKTDATPDRAGRYNRELLRKIPDTWLAGRLDPMASVRVLEGLRKTTPTESADLIVESLQQGIHPKSLYDGIFLSASELVTRQPAIVPLHAVTTTNAIHYLYHRVSDDSLRKWLLLQNASFIAHFREAAQSRDKLPEYRLDQLQASELADIRLDSVFDEIHRNRESAAHRTLQFLNSGGSAEAMVRRARELVFLKGTDSHDYKFSSAAIEDFYAIDPRWRNQYLAGCTYLLHGESETTTAFAKKVLAL